MTTLRTALALAGVAAVLAACSPDAEEPETAANVASGPSGPAVPPAVAPTTETPSTVAAAGNVTEAVASGLPAPYATADLVNGKAKFAMCKSCHTITEGGPHGVGPNLHGVFGRKVGAAADYDYSEAVENADFVWDGPKLSEWLEKPKDFLPGTKMTFAGLKEQKDRTDLIAYLMTETGYKP